MTFDEQRRKYVVRWRENGRRRVRRFDTPEQAGAFERSHADATPATGARRDPQVKALERRLAELEATLAAAGERSGAAGDGVISYDTRQGNRFGFKFRQSDGSSSTRRGYTSRRA